MVCCSCLPAFFDGALSAFSPLLSHAPTETRLHTDHHRGRPQKGVGGEGGRDPDLPIRNRRDFELLGDSGDKGRQAELVSRILKLVSGETRLPLVSRVLMGSRGETRGRRAGDQFCALVSRSSPPRLPWRRQHLSPSPRLPGRRGDMSPVSPNPVQSQNQNPPNVACVQGESTYEND